MKHFAPCHNPCWRPGRGDCVYFHQGDIKSCGPKNRADTEVQPPLARESLFTQLHTGDPWSLQHPTRSAHSLGTALLLWVIGFRSPRPWGDCESTRPASNGEQVQDVLAVPRNQSRCQMGGYGRLSLLPICCNAKLTTPRGINVVNIESDQQISALTSKGPSPASRQKKQILHSSSPPTIKILLPETTDSKKTTRNSLDAGSQKPASRGGTHWLTARR